jgi:hypothetical protein
MGTYIILVPSCNPVQELLTLQPGLLAPPKGLRACFIRHIGIQHSIIVGFGFRLYLAAFSDIGRGLVRCDQESLPSALASVEHLARDIMIRRLSQVTLHLLEDFEHLSPCS